MIEQFWTALGAIVVVVIALVGGFWRLRQHIDDFQRKYSDSISAMEAKIRSSKMLPEIIKLILEVEKDRATDSNATLEAILSEEKYLRFIRGITQSENEIIEIKNRYSSLKATISTLSNNLLILAFLVSGIVPICYFFDTPYVDSVYLSLISWVVAITILYFIIFSVVLRVSRYLSLSKDLSSKYDEIIIGVPPTNNV